MSLSLGLSRWLAAAALRNLPAHQLSCPHHGCCVPVYLDPCASSMCLFSSCFAAAITRAGASWPSRVNAQKTFYFERLAVTSLVAASYASYSIIGATYCTYLTSQVQKTVASHWLEHRATYRREECRIQLGVIGTSSSRHRRIVASHYYIA